MVKVTIPGRLREEFRTVEAVLASDGATRRVDALVLAWVKYEKQLRRLFCFLVFQHPKMKRDQIDNVIEVLARNRKLYPETFIAGIDALGIATVAGLLGARHTDLAREMLRIKKYRNKLIHGQISGQKISSRELVRDVEWIIDWVSSLADGSQRVFGYDGLRRNTYSLAREASGIAGATYPFDSAAQLKAWLRTLNEAVVENRT
jgi:hypothetical protein